MYQLREDPDAANNLPENGVEPDKTSQQARRGWLDQVRLNRKGDS
jgi:hypothetical protein